MEINNLLKERLEEVDVLTAQNFVHTLIDVLNEMEGENGELIEPNNYMLNSNLDDLSRTKIMNYINKRPRNQNEPDVRVYIDMILRTLSNLRSNCNDLVSLY